MNIDQSNVNNREFYHKLAKLKEQISYMRCFVVETLKTIGSSKNDNLHTLNRLFLLLSRELVKTNEIYSSIGSSLSSDLANSTLSQNYSAGFQVEEGICSNFKEFENELTYDCLGEDHDSTHSEKEPALEEDLFIYKETLLLDNKEEEYYGSSEDVLNYIKQFNKKNVKLGTFVSVKFEHFTKKLYNLIVVVNSGLFIVNLKVKLGKPLSIETFAYNEKVHENKKSKYTLFNKLTQTFEYELTKAKEHKNAIEVLLESITQYSNIFNQPCSFCLKQFKMFNSKSNIFPPLIILNIKNERRFYHINCIKITTK